MAEHYFSEEPSAASRPRVVHLRLPDMNLALSADAGVFSAGRVDPGTIALLRESSAPPASGNLLDLGCGYGPIACALARRSPGATVWGLDVNSRALELTARNAHKLGLANLRTAAPGDVPAGIEFAGIWSNPPIRIGKQALRELLQNWLGRLQEGASGWIVMSRHLGGDSFASWLADQGWAVRRAASKSSYRILQVQR